MLRSARSRRRTKNLGTLTLDEFLVHPKSYAQACIVVHEGRIVYESYPAMQPTDHYLWMSVAKTLAGRAQEPAGTDRQES